MVLAYHLRLTSQNAQKTLLLCVVYTNMKYTEYKIVSRQELSAFPQELKYYFEDKSNHRQIDR